MEELKPCPFCGGEVMVSSSPLTNRFAVLICNPGKSQFYNFEIGWQMVYDLAYATEILEEHNAEKILSVIGMDSEAEFNFCPK